MATTLAKKLLLKPGQRVAFVNVPSRCMAALEPLPDGLEVTSDLGSPVDAALLFVATAAELAQQAGSVLGAVRRDGLLWIAYRKGGAKAGTDLNRDILWNVMSAAHSWEGVSLVAVDDEWSAMRFRPSSSGKTA